MTPTHINGTMTTEGKQRPFVQDTIKLRCSQTSAQTGRRVAGGSPSRAAPSIPQRDSQPLNYRGNSLQDREETHVKTFPVALHSDKRIHADHSGPKSPAWLKVPLKIHTRIGRNVLGKQPGTKRENLFRLVASADGKVAVSATKREEFCSQKHPFFCSRCVICFRSKRPQARWCAAAPPPIPPIGIWSFTSWVGVICGAGDRSRHVWEGFQQR